MLLKRHWNIVILVLTLALVAAACGPAEEEVTGTTASDGVTTPTEAEDDGDATTAPPEETLDDGDEVSAAPPRQAGDDTVVVAWSGDLNSLDPPDSLVVFNREASLALYDTLLRYDFEERDDGTLVWTGLDVAPGLATDWEIDGNAVTFHLREDAVFNGTGNPVTAEDVKWSFVRSIEVPGFGRFNSNLAGIYEPDRQITVVDDHTIRFEFETADGTPRLLTVSLPSLRFPIFGIVDSVEAQSHATDEDPWAHEWLVENAAGSGPYTIASRTPGTELVLQRVDGHWSGTPDFERVIFRIFSGPADITSVMLRGEVDLASQLGRRELEALEEAGLKVLNAPIPDIFRLDMTVDTPPLDSVEVRQAIAHAIPYDAIVNNAFAQAERAYSFVNPAAPQFAQAWDRYDTNLDVSRQLLADAGYGDGFPIDLYYDTGVREEEDIALLIEAGLAEVGIDVTLRPLPSTSFAEQSTARVNGEDVMQGLAIRHGVIWLDDAATMVPLWIMTGGFSNTTGYGREDLDQLHAQFQYSDDEGARTDAYVTIQEEAAADAPLVPLAVKGAPAAVHPDITGVAFTADPHLRSYLLRKADG